MSVKRNRLLDCFVAPMKIGAPRNDAYRHVIARPYSRSNLVGKFLLFSVFLCGYLFAEEFTYDSHGKKDPFSPPVVSAVEKAGTEVLVGVRLEGIIWDEKKPIAVINDKVVGIGDVVSGAKIIDIKQNEVIFDVDGQMVNVKLRVPEGGQTSFQ